MIHCARASTGKADLHAVLANRVKQSLSVICSESEWKQRVIEHTQAEVKTPLFGWCQQ